PGGIHSVRGGAVLHSGSVAKTCGNASGTRCCDRWRTKLVRRVAATIRRDLCRNSMNQACTKRGHLSRTAADAATRVLYVVSPTKTVFVSGKDNGYLGNFEQWD